MKMKRFLAVFAIIAVLCTFCTVAAMADEGATTVPPVGEEGQVPPAGGDAKPAEPSAGTTDTDEIPEGCFYITVEITGNGGTVLENHLVSDTPIAKKTPTCTEAGWIRYRCMEDECTSEDLWHEVVVQALDHDWSTDLDNADYWGAVIETPTCQHGGSAYEYCTRCGEKGEIRELDPIDHVYTKTDSDGITVDNIVVDVDNCKQYKYHRVCVNCNEPETNEKGEIVYNKDQSPIVEEDGSLHHTWSDWKVETEATCEHKGEMTRVCTTCGAKQVEYTDALPHEWKVAHTHLNSCTEIEVTYKCANCDAEKTEFIYGDFHQYVIDEVTKEATCLNEGEATLKCKYCGNPGDCTQKIPALGHDWTEWTLSDTYTKDGEELGFYRRDCKRCKTHVELVSATAPVEEPEIKEPETVANIYAIDAANVVKGENSVSGTGNLIVVGTEEVGEMYARVAVVYENEAGEQILVVNVAEVKADLTFKIPSVKAPYGYSVKTVCLVAVTSDEAVEGAWADYAVCDNVVL